MSIFFMVALVMPLQAQNPQAQNRQAQNSEYAEKAGTTPGSNYIVPLPSSRSLSATQLAGKKLFVQRCSVCHLPGLPTYKHYGPLLDGKLIAARGEAAEREQISNGSLRMPGFQYVFEPADIDNIIAYLKTLEYDPTAQKYKYANNSTKK